ncbi:hypothetical protein BH24ACT5_BH24ACT5_21830 [soil metagenome]
MGELGAQAAKLLLRSLTGEAAEGDPDSVSRDEIVLSTEFLPRPSCGPPPA